MNLWIILTEGLCKALTLLNRLPVSKAVGLHLGLSAPLSEDNNLEESFITYSLGDIFFFMLDCFHLWREYVHIFWIWISHPDHHDHFYWIIN